MPLILLLGVLRHGRQANLWFMSFLILICGEALMNAVGRELGGVYDLRWKAIYDLQLLAGPLLYFYTRSLTDTDERWQSRISWHFLPAGAAVGIWFLQLPLTANDWLLAPCPADQQCDLVVRARSIHRWAGSFSVLVYAVVALRLLTPHRERIKATYSSIEDFSLNWLRVLLYFFIISAAVNVLTELQRW